MLPGRTTLHSFPAIVKTDSVHVLYITHLIKENC